MHVENLPVASVAADVDGDDDELVFRHKITDASLVLGRLLAGMSLYIELEALDDGRLEEEEEEEEEVRKSLRKEQLHGKSCAFLNERE